MPKHTQDKTLGDLRPDTYNIQISLAFRGETEVTVNPDLEDEFFNPHSSHPPHSLSIGLEVGGHITATGNEVWEVLGRSPMGELACRHVRGSTYPIDPPHEYAIIPDIKDVYAPVEMGDGRDPENWGEPIGRHDKFIGNEQLTLAVMRGEPVISPSGDVAIVAGHKFRRISPEPMTRDIHLESSTVRHVQYDAQMHSSLDFQRFWDAWVYTADVELRMEDTGEIVTIDYRTLTASWKKAKAFPIPKQPLPARGGVVSSMWGTGEKKQWLYRMYGPNRELLYIGISKDAFKRFKQHAREKGWIDEVASWEREPYPDRESVESAEREAIVRESPKYNIVHNRGSETV